MAALISSTPGRGADTKGEAYVWSTDQTIELQTYEAMAHELQGLGFKVKVQKLWVFTAADPVAYLRLE